MKVNTAALENENDDFFDQTTPVDRTASATATKSPSAALTMYAYFRFTLIEINFTRRSVTEANVKAVKKESTKPPCHHHLALCG